jgi:hypothetical protein
MSFTFLRQKETKINRSRNEKRRGEEYMLQSHFKKNKKIKKDLMRLLLTSYKSFERINFNFFSTQSAKKKAREEEEEAYSTHRFCERWVKL